MQKNIQIFVVLFISVIGLGYADDGCNLCTPNNIPNTTVPAPEAAVSQDENTDDMEEIYDEDDDALIIEEEETESTPSQ